MYRQMDAYGYGDRSMNSAVGFDLTVDCDPEKRLTDPEVHAFVKVTSAGPDDSGVSGTAALAEVVLLDLSSSMGYQPSKLDNARQACCATIDALPDGTRFAVVGGTDVASMIYPPGDGGTADADTGTRAEAKLAVLAAESGGRTIISSWLDRARELLAPHPDRVRHAILLTDGKNEHQALARRPLETVLADCQGVFTCDARGIGADFDPQELNRIAGALHGTADAVPELTDLQADFRAMTGRALGRVVPQAALRVRCTRGVTVAAVEEQHPSQTDLTAHDRQVPGSTATDYLLGPWSREAREYVVTLRADRDTPAPGTVDLLAVVEVVTGAVGTAEAVVRSAPVRVEVRRVDVPSQHTVGDTLLRHHEKERELRALRWQGGNRFRAGDLSGAREVWGRSVALATELNNQDALRRLRKVVRIDDPVRGVVEPLPGLRPEYVYHAMMGATTSTPFPAPPAPRQPAPPPPPAPDGPGPTCPVCRRIAVPGARFCEKCDHRFTSDPPEPGA